MSFHELFSQSTIVEIPLFQREYVWTQKQFTRMINEIDAIIDGADSSRFLGAVIAVKKSDHPSEPAIYEVVDGQQRLTSLFLFTIAAVQVAARKKEVEYAKSLIKKYLIIDWWEKDNTAMVTGYKDRLQFNTIFEQLFRIPSLQDWLPQMTNLPHPSGDENGKFIKQYNRMRRLLEKRYTEKGIDGVEEFLNCAITKMTFVFITLNDPSNATKVFEGLNDPGIPIGIGDLVRNEVFSKISSEPQRAFQVHRDEWLPFTQKLKDNYDKYFFPYAIIESSINNADLFRGLRRIWGEVNEPREIIDKLDYYTQPFMAILGLKTTCI